MRIDRILCPVDFSKMSLDALATARTLARRHRATLYVQHVFQFQPMPFECYAPSTYLADRYVSSREAARGALRALAESSDSTDEDVRWIMSDGLVVDSIRSLARREGVDLIVMTSKGRGSVSDKVARGAPCPVVVRRIRHGIAADTRAMDGTIRLRRVVFPTDLGGPATGALRYALKVAEEYGAEVTLLHVVERGRHARRPHRLTATAARRLGGMVSAYPSVATTVVPVVREGRAHEQIVQYATATRADLVVMPVRARSSLERVVFGSTARQVLKQGPCPVMTVQTTYSADSRGEPRTVALS